MYLTICDLLPVIQSIDIYVFIYIYLVFILALKPICDILLIPFAFNLLLYMYMSYN